MTPVATSMQARRRSWTAARLAIPFAAVLFAMLPTAALAADGLVVSAQYPAVVVAPGSKVSFDISIRTTQSERVGLTVEGAPADWTVALRGGGYVIDGVQTQVAPGTEAGTDAASSVRLDITVPPTAAAATVRMDVVARGPTETARLPLSVRVSPEAAGQVGLRTDFPQLRGASDATFSFNLTLANDTAEDQSFGVAATGPTGWTVDAKVSSQAQAATAIVKAGSTTAIQVTAKAPPGVAAGTYPIVVEATGGPNTARTELAVQVTGTYALTVTTPDGRLNAQASAGSVTDMSLVVRNTGTAAAENVKVVATLPSGWTATFEPDTVTVPPGSDVQVTAHLTPSSAAIAGDYVATFRASNDLANASAQIRVTVETSLLWGAVGLGLIVLVLIGLGVVFQRYGRR